MASLTKMMTLYTVIRWSMSSKSSPTNSTLQFLWQLQSKLAHVPDFRQMTKFWLSGCSTVWCCQVETTRHTSWPSSLEKSSEIRSSQTRGNWTINPNSEALEMWSTFCGIWMRLPIRSWACHRLSMTVHMALETLRTTLLQKTNVDWLLKACKSMSLGRW